MHTVRIGAPVQLALELWAAASRHDGDRRRAYSEAAMLHACNAVAVSRRCVLFGTAGDVRRACGFPVVVYSARITWNRPESQRCAETAELLDYIAVQHD